VRRASAGLSPVRAGALLAMLLAAAAVYGVANSSAFEFQDVRLEGVAYTDAAAVERSLADVRRSLDRAIANMPDPNYPKR